MVLFSLVWAFVCPVQYLFNGLIELTDMIHARVKETRIFMENRPLLIACRLVIQDDTDSTHINQHDTDSTVEMLHSCTVTLHLVVHHHTGRLKTV